MKAAAAVFVEERRSGSICCKRGMHFRKGSKASANSSATLSFASSGVSESCSDSITLSESLMFSKCSLLLQLVSISSTR